MAESKIPLNRRLQISTVWASFNSSGFYKWTEKVDDVMVVSANSNDRYVRPFVGSDDYWYFTTTGWNLPQNVETNISTAIDIVYFKK